MPNRVMDCRVKPGNDGGEAREPGPITTALTTRKRHGVWVPAVAGTTAVRGIRFSAEAFALSLSHKGRAHKAG
jgi:hypothetical protein